MAYEIVQPGYAYTKPVGTGLSQGIRLPYYARLLANIDYANEKLAKF